MMFLQKFIRFSQVILMVGILSWSIFGADTSAQVLATTSTATYNCSTQTDIPQSECEALIAIYNATNGNNWYNSEGWLNSNELCGWYGIRCNDGHVSSLELSSNNLSGAIPAEIGNLSSLSWHLDLGSNQITSIPPEVGNLTDLYWLTLSDNQLTAIPSEIANLNGLYWLSLSDNPLQTVQPAIGNIPNLSRLYLNNTQISSLPATTGNLGGLTQLWVDDNQLTTLPPEIGNLSNLRWLYVRHNQLTTLPATMGNLNVTEMFLDHNQLSTLPPEIGNMPSLLALSVSNNHLSSLPNELSNRGTLRSLSLQNNPLSGQIPSFLTSLTNVEFLRYYGTNWCVPNDTAVQTWLQNIPNVDGTGLVCGQPAGSIIGDLQGINGLPLSAYKVVLYQEVFGNNRVYIAETTTDADGAYQFVGLGQGINYFLAFEDSEGKLQYYQNTFSLLAAQPINVTFGVAEEINLQVVSRYDLYLPVVSR